jgi:hypothetical protein
MFKNMNECIVERNPLYVRNVGEPSVIKFPSQTQNNSHRRSPTHASNVEKPSFCWVTFKDIRELTGKRNPLYVSNMEKPSVVPVTSKFMKNYTGEKPYVSAMQESLLCLNQFSMTCMNSVKRKTFLFLSDLHRHGQLLSRNPMFWFDYEMSSTGSCQMLDLQLVVLFWEA